MALVACVVPAGGVGIRMGLSTPKQLLTLHGRSILAHTLCNLKKVPAVDLIIVVTSLSLLEKIQIEVDKVLEDWSVELTEA